MFSIVSSVPVVNCLVALSHSHELCLATLRCIGRYTSSLTKGLVEGSTGGGMRTSLPCLECFASEFPALLPARCVEGSILHAVTSLRCCSASGVHPPHSSIAAVHAPPKITARPTCTTHPGPNPTPSANKPIKARWHFGRLYDFLFGPTDSDSFF